VSGSARVGIEGRALAHRFAPGRGLEPVSFAHEGPGCVAVVGPNGAGKSTLLRVVAGLVRPNAGALTVTSEGRAVAASARRGLVGFASPDLAFYDELTVEETLAFAAEARGLADRPAHVRCALERVGLAARAGDLVATLSSGMRQRLRLAFAVLHRPAILLLDEPGSHLDEAGRALTDAIVAEHRREGLVLLATNDEREARLADSRIELRGGLGDPA
jgi:heme exporter protein A